MLSHAFRASYAPDTQHTRLPATVVRAFQPAIQFPRTSITTRHGHRRRQRQIVAFHVTIIRRHLFVERRSRRRGAKQLTSAVVEFDCINCARHIGTYTLSGVEIHEFECTHDQIKGRCSATKIDGLHCCTGCNKRVTAAQASGCIHRGAKLREQEADLCGFRGVMFSVNACAIHDECSLLRYCQKQTIKSCATCADRKSSHDDADQ